MVNERTQKKVPGRHAYMIFFSLSSHPRHAHPCEKKTPRTFPLPPPPTTTTTTTTTTTKQVRIVGAAETFACIKEFVDPANIPKCYGGELR
jgi:hypothetical protein